MPAATAAAASSLLLVATLLLCASCAHATMYSENCPADSTVLSHNNSVYNATIDSGVPAAGPKLPTMSRRPMRTHGSVGSCVGSTAEGFDGGEIVIAATTPLYGPQSTNPYARIMLHTAEIFLDWLNLERQIPNQTRPGGLMIGGKRYSMRFSWVDDAQQASEASTAIAHAIRRENTTFGWGGYGSTMSRLQAEQAELDGVLFMASIAAAPDVVKGRELVFGTLPPDYTYIQNAVRAVAQAATGAGDTPAATELRLGLVYMSPLNTMCDPITLLAQELGMTVAAEWLSHNKLERYPSESSVDSVLQRLRDDGVNVVVGCVYHDGGEAIVEAMERLDFTPYAAAFTSTVDISVYQDRVRSGWWQGEYALGVSPWHSSLEHAGGFSNMTSAEYLQRYQTRYGTTPSYHGPASFSAACALAAAIEAAGSLNANDVATSLRKLSLQELGFYSPMNFSEADGQNQAEMLVLQFQAGEKDLKIVYPPAVPGSASVQFPMPTWGKRRCIALGSGAVFGGEAPPNLLASECSGHGMCQFARHVADHEVYECACNSGWIGNDCSTEQRTKNVSVALLFPLSELGGSHETEQLVAAHLAIQHINAGGILLPNHNLVPVEIDTALLRVLEGSVLQGVAIDDIRHRLDESGVAAAVGAGYSTDVAALAPIVEDILLLSPSATAAALSNESVYPKFGRLVTPDSQQVMALADVVEYGHGHYGWKKVGFVQCHDLYCSGLAHGTRQQLSNLGITDVTDLATIHATAEGSIDAAISLVRQWLEDCDGVPVDASAVVVLLTHAEEGTALLEMGVGLPTSWLGSESIGSFALGSDAALQSGVIALTPGGPDPSHALYTFLFQQQPDPGPMALRSFDAVYTLAHAMKAVLDEGGSIDNASALALHTQSVSFEGASGDIRFSEGLDRIGSYDIRRSERVQINGSSVIDSVRSGQWNADDRSITKLRFGELIKICLPDDPDDSSFLDYLLWVAALGCASVFFYLHFWVQKREQRKFDKFMKKFEEFMKNGVQDLESDDVLERWRKWMVDFEAFMNKLKNQRQDLKPHYKSPLHWILGKVGSDKIQCDMIRSILKLRPAAYHWKWMEQWLPIGQVIHSEDVPPLSLKIVKCLLDDGKLLDLQRFRDIAAAHSDEPVKRWVRSHGQFLHRYRRDPGPPVHRSRTATVFYAKDELCQDSKDSKVCIKMMRDKTTFEAEVMHRFWKGAQLEHGTVVQVLEWFGTEQFELDQEGTEPHFVDTLHPDETEWREKRDSNSLRSLIEEHSLKIMTEYADAKTASSRELESVARTTTGNTVTFSYPYVLVMRQGERSLHDACAKEWLPGYDMNKVVDIFRDVVTCVGNLHASGIIHADLKPRNIVRAPTVHANEVQREWVLCDMDAAARIDEPIGRKTSTAYAPPELARIKSLPTTFDPSADPPIAFDNTQLPCAKPSFDVWSLGVILFELCSGRTLFRQDTNNDDLVEEAGLHDSAKLLAWQTIGKDQLDLVFNREEDDMRQSHDCHVPETTDHAKDLIRWCLQGDYTKRPTTEQMLKHPLLNPTGKRQKIVDSTAELLHKAVEQGEVDTVRQMLQKGEAHVTMKLRSVSVLHRAARRGDAAMVELLLSMVKPADRVAVLDAQFPPYNFTALHWCATYASGIGNTEKLAPQSQSESESQLESAPRQYAEVAQILIESGCNTDLRTHRDKTAWDQAAQAKTVVAVFNELAQAECSVPIPEAEPPEPEPEQGHQCNSKFLGTVRETLKLKLNFKVITYNFPKLYAERQRRGLRHEFEDTFRDDIELDPQRLVFWDTQRPCEFSHWKQKEGLTDVYEVTDVSPPLQLYIQAQQGSRSERYDRLMVKVFKLADDHRRAAQKEFVKREVESLSHLTHENVAAMLGVCEGPSKNSGGKEQIMQLLEPWNMDLKELLAKGKFDDGTAYRLLTQIAAGMDYIHSQTTTTDAGQTISVLHLDLNTTTVLLGGDPADQQSLKVKLAVFSSSNQSKERHRHRREGDRQFRKPDDVHDFGQLMKVMGHPEGMTGLDKRTLDLWKELAEKCTCEEASQRPSFPEIQQTLRFWYDEPWCTCTDVGREHPTDWWDEQTPICVVSSPSKDRHDVDAMRLITALATSKLKLAVGFDFAGSLNADPSDTKLFQLLEEVDSGDLETKETVLKQTKWWTTYTQQVVGTAKLMCQMSDNFKIPGVSSECIIYCVNGGPISQVEAINMRRIITNVDLPNNKKEANVVFEIMHGDLLDFLKFVDPENAQKNYDEGCALARR